MDEKKVLLKMVKQLQMDIQNIQQKGAGYYSATPFVDTYNRLLAKNREIFKKKGVLLDVLVEVEDTKSVDPAEKMKVTQKVMVAVGQLIAFIEATDSE